ncbi:MAG: hypothetical protein C4522_20445, partial [Desulfobacteraceae bacterium]
MVKNVIQTISRLFSLHTLRVLYYLVKQRTIFQVLYLAVQQILFKDKKRISPIDEYLSLIRKAPPKELLATEKPIDIIIPV